MALDSAHAFIRALKAPTDPPQAENRTKIQLAREAWDSTLYVPSKSEVLVDWLLSQLLKNQRRVPLCSASCSAAYAVPSALLDARYWTLLGDILERDAAAATAKSRAWLLPILIRVPVVPILAGVLNRLADEPAFSSSGIARSITRSYTVLLPLAVPKASQDALVDCFWALLHASATPGAQDVLHTLGNVPDMVIHHFKDAFAASASKRKICSTFVTDGHLVDWVNAETRGPTAESRRVLDMLYTAVCETLFCVDGIRHHIVGDDSTQDGFFSRLSKPGPQKPPVFVQQTLPKLFLSFCQAARKQRTALFPEGSNAASRTNAADEPFIAFFRSCVAYVELYPPPDQWIAYTALVDAIRLSNLYTRGSSVQGELKALALRAAVALDSTTAAAPIELLTTILRLDYDLVSDISMEILRNIACASSDVETAAYEYASSALDYARKTRSVDDHLISVCASLRAGAAHESDPKVAHARISRNVFSRYEWRREMTTAVSAFLTPGQTNKLLSELLGILTAEYEAYSTQLRVLGAGAQEKTSKKKARSAPASETVTSCVTLAVALQYVSTVFCAASARSQPAGSSSIAVGISSLLQVLDDVDSSLQPHILGNSKSWALSALQACTLRSRYNIITALASAFAPVPPIPASLDALFGADVNYPELRVELDRMLLMFIACSPDNTAPSYIDSLLQRLEENLDPAQSWDGFVTPREGSAVDGKFSATVTWSSILLRWLPLADDRWTATQLQRLVKFIFTVHHSHADDEGSAKAILNRVLVDASFWELRRIADIIEEQLTEATACFADVDVAKTVKRATKGKAVVSEEQLEQAVAAFHFAMRVPAQVIGRAQRDELLRRAFVADIACSVAVDDQALERRSAIRQYIAHHADAGMPELAPEAVQFFVDSGNFGSSTSQEFIGATLEVADTLFAFLLRTEALPLFESVATKLARGLNQNTEKHQRALNEQLVACLFRSVARVKLEKSEIASVSQRLVQVAAVHVSAICRRLQGGDETYDLFDIAHTLDLSVAIRRQTTGAYDDDVASVLLPRLAQTLQSTPELRTEAVTGVICSRLLMLAWEVLRKDPQRSMGVVATYAAVSRMLASEERRRSVDASLSEICKDLPVVSYESLLHELHDAIATLPRERQADLSAVLRLSALLSRDVPEGTSKIARDHARLCMTVILNDDFATQSQGLRLEVLRHIESICRERVMSLQVQDVGQIWLLLGQILSPSAVHDEHTSSAQFTVAVAAATSLVRLRRDLVAPTLPHLTQVLRLQLGALRSPRPQLGAKQLRYVCNELPRFISAHADGSGGLGADEARALARLLAALATKTTIVGRGHETASLARPFSHHAPSVLLAYVSAAAAPLTVLPLAVRRELEPGLFALCGMAGEHGRDSLMAGTAGGQLDAAGKAVFKALWKEFEKQRYVGTG
ncbi:hypothetical protein AURDEDRAFT_155547 [Auricularia subglabra TFB-10046 SS5]|nr:hypothetical protein AURDEDRAFT_155547 [Auricularia subglabra TFB-10046 SS5]